MGNTGIVEALLPVLVAGVLVVLVVRWLLGAVRRQKRWQEQRECPACGVWVKRGELKCGGCGCAFRRAVR